MKNKLHSRYVIFSWLACLLIFSNIAAAELIAPQITIKETSNQLKEKLKDETFLNDFKGVTNYVENLITPHVDFYRISALVLGQMWRTATNEQKMDFTREFQRLLVRTYSRAFVEFNDWSIRFLPLNIEEGEKKVIVKTEILQPGIQPVGVDYRMLLTKGSWKIYDISIEGVSLVTNYRTSFKNEVKRTGSLQAVIDQMAARNNEALNTKESS